MKEACKFVEAVSNTFNATGPLQEESPDAAHQQEPWAGAALPEVAADGDGWGSGLLPLFTISHCVVCHRAGEKGFYAALLSLIFIRVIKMVLEDSEDG